MAVTRDAALRALESALPDASVDSLRRLPHGTTNATFEVEFHDETPVVLKICGETRDPGRFCVEPAIQRLVADRTSVPTPGVVHVDTSERHVSRPFFLMESVPGRNLEQQYKHLPTRTKQRLVVAAGRQLSALHRSVTFDGFGRIERTESGVRPRSECSDWHELFRRLLRQRLTDLRGTRFEEFVPRISALEIDREPFLAVDEATLVHRDFRLGNLLVDDQVRAVLDWEFAVAGDSEFDVVKAETNLTARFRTSRIVRDLRRRFYSAYLRTGRLGRGFPVRREYYRLCPLLEAMGAFEYWAANMSPDERERNAAHFRQQLTETIRRIEAVESGRSPDSEAVASKRCVLPSPET